MPTYAPAPGTIGRRRVAQAKEGQREAIALTIMRPVTMVAVTCWAMGMYVIMINNTNILYGLRSFLSSCHNVIMS